VIEGYSAALAVAAAIGAGLAAGVLFAFSAFVMRALGRLPAAQGISAMQAINKAAPTPLFMTALFGTAMACVALAALALSRLGEPQALYMLIGSALYLAGIVLTIAYHVPRNNALALLDPHSSDAAADWARYLTAWTAWNHVRTLTSLASAVTFTLALRLG
jgi:uncharacterized membrane protein